MQPRHKGLLPRLHRGRHAGGALYDTCLFTIGPAEVRATVQNRCKEGAGHDAVSELRSKLAKPRAEFNTVGQGPNAQTSELNKHRSYRRRPRCYNAAYNRADPARASQIMATGALTATLAR